MRLGTSTRTWKHNIKVDLYRIQKSGFTSSGSEYVQWRAPAKSIATVGIRYKADKFLITSRL
jgi:hypothetical protein